jgi:DNA polymerase/3'-5' exonuclease PolX
MARISGVSTTKNTAGKVTDIHFKLSKVPEEIFEALEDYIDLQECEKRKDEPTYTLEEVKKKLPHLFKK